MWTKGCALNLCTFALAISCLQTEISRAASVFEEPRTRSALRSAVLRHKTENNLVNIRRLMYKEDPSVVKTPLGDIQGQVLSKGRRFRTIPYAVPPVGKLRWQSPIMVKSWKPSVVNATQDPPGCIQDCGEPPLACPKTTSENCLFLNVFTPRLEEIKEPLPVLLGLSFIHGGNFKDGYGGGPLYDGIHLANTSNIIVVTINYRLNALGFLYTGSGSPTSINGNFGIQDQRMAMRWVRKYIAYFGGSSSHTTIMGQSAGAQSVATHLISTISDPYFDAGMMISEPMGLPFRPAHDASKWGRLIASKIDCGNDSTPIQEIEACFRAQPPSKLLEGDAKARADFTAQLDNLLYVFSPWSPIVGFSDCPLQPIFGMTDSRYSQQKPVFTGQVHQEGWLFVYSGFGFLVPEVLFDVLCSLIFGPSNLERIKLQYPIPPSMVNDTRPIISLIATDSLFRCPVRHAMQGLWNNTAGNVWMYHFNHLSSFSKKMWGNTSTMCWDHVCHGSDLPYWFMPDMIPYGLNYSAEEFVLASAMSEYAGNFARDYNPGSAPSEPLEWAQYKSQTIQEEKSMYFKTPKNELRVAPFEDPCDFWDSIGYSFINGDKS